ncbi:MAG: helix-turn-helix transcriptional regulator [Tepidisphaeraceae bacterium]
MLLQAFSNGKVLRAENTSRACRKARHSLRRATILAAEEHDASWRQRRLLSSVTLVLLSKGYSKLKINLLTRQINLTIVPLVRNGAECPAATVEEGELPSLLRPVLDQLLEGLAEKEVAKQLAMNQHTVHGHVKRLYLHFGVNSRAALLARVLRQQTRGVTPGGLGASPGEQAAH